MTIRIEATNLFEAVLLQTRRITNYRFRDSSSGDAKACAALARNDKYGRVVYGVELKTSPVQDRPIT